MHKHFSVESEGFTAKYPKSLGFTIVELLIVIVVIGILAAISIVAYNGIQTRAMDTRIKAVVNDTGKALLLERLDGNIPATGHFGNPNGVDSVVRSQYLGSDYRDGLKSSNHSNDGQIFRYYACGANAFVIYASLNNPSSQELSNFQSAKTRCSHSNTQAPVTSPRVYNFARVFE